MPISLFLTKCSGQDVYNVEKSKVLISETVLRLNLIAFITSIELSIDQHKLILCLVKVFDVEKVIKA